MARCAVERETVAADDRRDDRWRVLRADRLRKRQRRGRREDEPGQGNCSTPHPHFVTVGTATGHRIRLMSGMTFLPCRKSGRKASPIIDICKPTPSEFGTANAVLSRFHE